jgi:peptide-methionine (R)-S-oxide reductase
MTNRRQFIAATGSLIVLGPAVAWLSRPDHASARAGRFTFPVVRTDAAWRAALTPAQYRVLRGGGTEWANSSPLNAEKRRGTFRCAGCGHALFPSAAKFDSHTGWPSFWQPFDGAVETLVDRSWLMVRTEVLCARCGGHLGHVFPDGPPPTGLRYCINGIALDFLPEG